MTEILSNDTTPRTIERSDIAVWIRSNLGVRVDFEDWGGLSDQEFRDLVCRVHCIDLDKVLAAMEVQDEV